MRLSHFVLAGSAAILLAGCGGGGVFGRDRPDEFAVGRSAPLVVPPDFALTPPRPGEADAGGDPRAQALQALFGGPQPRSAVERDMLERAGAAPRRGNEVGVDVAQADGRVRKAFDLELVLDAQRPVPIGAEPAPVL